MKAAQPSFDTKTPRRVHRTKQPWVEVEVVLDRDGRIAELIPGGKTFELGNKERATQASIRPLMTLTNALARSPEALQQLESIREGENPCEVAKNYVWRAGFTREVVAEVFRLAAASPVRDGRVAFCGVAKSAVWVNAPVGEGDAKQWGRAQSDPRIALRLTMIGGGRCSLLEDGEACGVKLAHDRGRQRFCSVHEQRRANEYRCEILDRNERVEITKFLHRVGRSLGLG